MFPGRFSTPSFFLSSFLGWKFNHESDFVLSSPFAKNGMRQREIAGANDEH
jgi:hypothetical protein